MIFPDFIVLFSCVCFVFETARKMPSEAVFFWIRGFEKMFTDEQGNCSKRVSALSEHMGFSTAAKN